MRPRLQLPSRRPRSSRGRSVRRCCGAHLRRLPLLPDQLRRVLRQSLSMPFPDAEVRGKPVLRTDQDACDAAVALRGGMRKLRRPYAPNTAKRRRVPPPMGRSCRGSTGWGRAGGRGC